MCCLHMLLARARNNIVKIVLPLSIEVSIIIEPRKRQEQFGWDFSSVGRAPALQAGGRRFEPDKFHHIVAE